tara:strand:- start:11064 stop:12545 length:1482 start_codon:yes stop_codon:yes gene_type:complete
MGQFTKMINRLLDKGSKENAQAVLNELMKEAEKWRPPNYAAEMKRRRDYYEGKQGAWLRDALARRYPSTYNEMSQIALNYARLIADVDACVYDHRPNRELWVGSDPVEDTPESREYQRITIDAALNVTLAEGERRLMLMNTMFLHVRYNFNRGYPMVELFYPQDVWVIPDPDNPTSIEDSYAVIARTVNRGGLTTPDDSFVVYYREVRPGSEGKDYGPWLCEGIDSDGGRTEIFPENLVPYGVLPFIVWRNGIADGTIYRDADNDLLDTIDAINVNFTNIAYVLDMQAHSMLAYEGDSRENIVGGPGKIISFAPGENLSVLDFDPKLKEMEMVNNNLIKTLASTRRQSPEAYSIEQKSPESGVARQIQNMPYLKALKERQYYAAQMESDLFPLFCRVSNAYTDGVTIDPDYYDMRWTAGDEPSFEEPIAKTTRILMALDSGLISRQRAAFEMGYYESEDEAARAMQLEVDATTTAIEANAISISERLQLATGS